MLQESTPISSQILLLSNLVTIILTVLGTLSTQRFMRRREPAEVAKIDAERDEISTNTELAGVDLTLLAVRELREFSTLAEQRRVAWIAREESLVDQRNEWRRKFEQLEFDLGRRVAQAEADAKASKLFVDQLYLAGQRAGVELQNYTPQQLDPRKLTEPS